MSPRPEPVASLADQLNDDELEHLAKSNLGSKELLERAEQLVASRRVSAPANSISNPEQLAALKKYASATRKRYVEAKLSVPGLHRWPMAPAALSHLRAYHRHQFVIRVSKEVVGNDHEMEFQALAHQVDLFLRDRYPTLPDDGYSISGLSFGHHSSEMLAEQLVDHFDLAWCSVHEDDEHGAVVVA